MNNKKGISALLETVLLILVVLAAAGIIFGAIIPMLRAPAERAALCQDAITVSATNAYLSLVQNKEVNLVNVSGSAINAAGAATQFVVTKPTNIGNVVTSSMPTTGGPFVKVQIVPVMNTSTGKSVACAPIEAMLQ